MVVTADTNLKKVKFENIPDELKHLGYWIMWRLKWNEKKQEFEKVPCNTKGTTVNAMDPNNWLDYETAKNTYLSGGFDGVGIVVDQSNNLYVLDIDGTTDDELLDAYSQGTYSEISPSGNGAHIYMLGDKPKPHTNKTEHYELYSNARFLTVTGDIYSDVDYVAEVDSHIDALIESKFKVIERTPIKQAASTYSDEEVINKLFKAKNNDKFKRLYEDADYSLFNGDASSADASLASLVAFYTQDVAQIERIMRQSALYRDKWDRRENGTPYIVRTIEKAVNYVDSANTAYEFDFIDEDKQDLKSYLTKRGIEERKKLEEYNESSKKVKKPRLTPKMCADILYDCLTFALFDLEENTRLAMYLADEGIYTRNTTIIQRVISWLEPALNEQQAYTVIYNLRNKADVRERTNSRYLIPVNNGVFNLKTKKLEPFTPEYIFTTKISTDYKDNAPAPSINSWDVDEWIREIACYDDATETLLWQVINDSLNGNYTRQRAIFFVGDGNNGKGTFQEMLTNLIGFKNVATLKVNEFDERFRLSMLEGKTVVIGDDVPPGVFIDDASNFKSVVTGDIVAVEQKNKPVYNTQFKCTVIQSTNTMPRFKDKTDGIFRRLLIVPFNAKFTDATENRDIKDDFIKRSEVLEYILYKAINMDFERFIKTDSIKLLLDEYKKDTDPIYEFKTEIFDAWESVIGIIPKMTVYSYYEIFCKVNGYKPVTSRKFHSELKEHIKDKWRSDTQHRVNETKWLYNVLKSTVDLSDEHFYDFHNKSLINLPGEGTTTKTYTFIEKNEDSVTE